MRSRPFSCDRRPSAKSSLPPYTCDPSHQWVSPVTYVGGPLASGLGSGFVRRIFIGCSGHGSSFSSGISQGSGSSGSWLSQSCTSNWIQAPASRLSVVAGWKDSRVRSRRLMSRGFGSSSRFGSSG